MKVLKVFLAVVAFAISAQVAFSGEAGPVPKDGWERPFLEYEANTVDPWGPFVLNLLIPLGGIGSFVQGDTTGGLIVLGGQVLGLGAVILNSGEGFWTAGMYIGAAVYGVATLLGYVVPFTYANAANEKLRRDLGISVSTVSLNEHGLNVTLAADLN